MESIKKYIILYFGISNLPCPRPPDAKNWLTGKDPDAGKDWRREEKGTTEDEMAGWHHWLDGHEFEQALGVGDGQGSLVCCSPWGHEESDTTEWLNWTELKEKTKDLNKIKVQLVSCVRLFATPWTSAHQASLSITNTQNFLKLMSVKSVMSSNHLILCHPLLHLPSLFPSIRVFSNESVLCIMWPKYWSFSFSISPSNEYLGLISLRIDQFDLLAVQGTLKSLLQHHSSETSILLHSAFFKVQLSHPYMTPGKNIALTRWTFVGKVMSLLFNMLSRLVITSLPRLSVF